MSHFYAARGKLHLIPSLIVFLLCFTLTFHGCGVGGGGSKNNGTPPSSSTAPVTYSTQNGNLTQLSLNNPSTSQSGTFNFVQNTASRTIFASGTITDASGTFDYIFDATGKLQRATNRALGTTTQFNYFADHIELLSLDSQGNTTSVLVLYAVGSSLIMGQAQPGIPYTLASLTNQTDVTAQINNSLAAMTNGTTLVAKTLPSFDLFPSAHAQSSTTDWSAFIAGLDDPGVRATIESIPFVVGAVLIVAAAGALGARLCGGGCGLVGMIAMTTFILTLWSKAHAAELIPSFNGRYTTTFSLQGGTGTCTHTESNNVTGDAVFVNHRWDCPPNGAGQPVNGTFTWSGALSVSSPTSATLTGSGTNTGSNGFFCSFNLQSGNIALNPDGSAVMNWGAVCPGGGFFGGTSFRSS